jgi:photosystem II stability/assembly factor-like uncharacterized protein
MPPAPDRGAGPLLARRTLLLRCGLAAATALGPSACGSDAATPAGPDLTAHTGRLSIGIATVGDAVTAGFSVRTEPPGRVDAVGSSDTLRLTGLAPGDYTVTLESVPSACTVDDGDRRTLTLAAGQERNLGFTVRCGTGTLAVVAVTTGTPQEPPFPGGHRIHVHPLGHQTRIGNDTLRLTVPPGFYTVTLDGVAGNCTLDGAAERFGSVRAAEELRVRFDIGCVPRFWSRVDMPTDRLLRIDFTDSLTGFALGRGVSPPVYGSTDGGRSWRLLATPATTDEVGQLFYFWNDRIGYIGGENHRLLRTEDGGATWHSRQLADTTRFLLTAFFLDSLNGWIGGGAGWLHRTRDAGHTWVRVPNPHDNSIFGIFFRDTLNGVFVGGAGGIYHTTDGGGTWTRRASGTNQHLQGLAFATDLIGVAAGGAGTLLRTVDGGLTWTPLSGASGVGLWKIAFAADGFGVVGGDNGTILTSHDRGASWQPELSFQTANMNTVAAVSAAHAWISSFGFILRRSLPP